YVLCSTRERDGSTAAKLELAPPEDGRLACALDGGVDDPSHAHARREHRDSDAGHDPGAGAAVDPHRSEGAEDQAAVAVDRRASEGVEAGVAGDVEGVDGDVDPVPC